MCEGDIMPIPK